MKNLQNYRVQQAINACLRICSRLTQEQALSLGAEIEEARWTGEMIKKELEAAEGDK